MQAVEEQSRADEQYGGKRRLYYEQTPIERGRARGALLSAVAQSVNRDGEALKNGDQTGDERHREYEARQQEH